MSKRSARKDSRRDARRDAKHAAQLRANWVRKNVRRQKRARVGKIGQYPPCPKCLLKLKRRSGRFGAFMACPNYPESCDICATRSKHDGLIYVSDQRTRDLRKECHRVFDRWWRNEFVDRSFAYTMLAKLLGIEKGHAHFQHFDVDMAERALEICVERLAMFEQDDLGVGYGVISLTCDEICARNGL